VSTSRLGRRALVAAALLGAAPALAYLLPASAVLKRMIHKREELALATLEVRGTLTAFGEAAPRAAEAGLPLLAGEASAPAFLVYQVPGRCRLEAALADAAPAERPAAIQRAGRLTGQRGLEKVAPAAALVQAVCLLLAERPRGAEPEQHALQALAALGVATADVALARQGGRVAYVIGGRGKEERPQAWLDKQTFQPLRLAATLGGARHEVRFLDWGSPTGGDQFPRAIEVWAGGQLRLRFVTEKVLANPRLPDSTF
jgi:hypothetical protein